MFLLLGQLGIGGQNSTQQLLYPEQSQLFLFLGQLRIGGQQCPHCPAAVVSSAAKIVFISRSVGDWGTQIPSSCCIPSGRNCTEPLCNTACRLHTAFPRACFAAIRSVIGWFFSLKLCEMLLDMLVNKKPTLYGLWKSSSLMLLGNDRFYSNK